MVIASCKSKATQSRAPKKKAKKKGDTDEDHKAKESQAKADAKEAKRKLAELSQKLVLSLVKMIEDEHMLKAALSLHPTESKDAPISDSGNFGVPDVAPSLRFNCFPFHRC